MRYPSQENIGRNAKGVTQKIPTPEMAKMLETVIHSHPLHEIMPEELKLLHEYRFNYKDTPSALSKCLRAIDWSTNESAHEVADMLRNWAPLTPEDALEILDSGFADQTIRAHAVNFLEHMGDDKLASYLLQLVQVLKYETYLDCDLSRFLLKRALRSQRIGHFFFWHLKSEMHLPDVSVRFGLLLEAYCRGCGPHMAEIQAQVGWHLSFFLFLLFPFFFFVLRCYHYPWQQKRTFLTCAVPPPSTDKCAAAD